MKLDALVKLGSVAIAALGSLTTVGCGDDHPYYDDVPVPTTSAPASDKAMLVEIDTGKTMDAVGGEGVGVFFEYAAGGTWHIWWTCDTNLSAEACVYDVSVAGKDSVLANVTTEGFGAKDTISVTPAESGSADNTAASVYTRTTTTTAVQGLTFVTTPGATILVEARVRGLAETGYLFFVQDEKVNGGFNGNITNPLYLRGTTP